MSDDQRHHPEVQKIRDAIDALDRQLLKILGARRKRCIDAAKAKEIEPDWFRDTERERDLLANRIQLGHEVGLDSHYVTTIFQDVLQDSIRLQQEYYQAKNNQGPGLVRVAMQGIEGSYSHLAGEDYFSRKGHRVVYSTHDQFKDVTDAVEKGVADLAILPIENTTSGGINEVYDLLLHAQLSIIGEVKLRVDHCLLGLPNAKLSDIKTVVCHPQTVLQCSKFLGQLPHCRIEYFTDTARSGKRIVDDGKVDQAAIASEQSARIYGLSIIARGIANQTANYTRFLVASRTAIHVDRRIPCKTSIVMMTGHQPGSLLDTLLVFRDHGINLTKLESRPILENPWEEMFYLDFEGNLADETIQRALDEVTRTARFIKVLGCYPSLDSRSSSARPVRASAPVESASWVERESKKAFVARTPPGYRLASREHRAEDSIIDIRGLRLGGEDLIVIAGPCAVETLEQIMACARAVKEAGGHVLRGGCFKPRTSPYSFQGLGFEGLDFLVEAGRSYNLPVVTEVLSPQDVARVADKADVLQVGARNMQNFTLLSEVGRARRPVMLKRGMSSSLDELLQAAEYILAAGNQQVFLCERGIRTFETATRNTLDLSAVPVLRSRTHLPVIVDPSHAAGQRDLVPTLSLAAKAAGAHAIMIEIHPEPEKALSDGPQALLFSQFQTLMGRLLNGERRGLDRDRTN